MNTVRIKQAAFALALTAFACNANALTYTFQEGVNGYVGTQDTLLRSASSATNTNLGAATSMSIDGDDSSASGNQPNHGLIRFDNLFGTAMNQIKATDVITSAVLRLVATDPGSGMNGHNMLTTWSESSTWSSMGSGISANGTEAQAAPVFSIGANNSTANIAIGTLSLNVLSSLQAWQSGSIANNGWALLPFAAGSNGIDFNTSEFATLNLRPQLLVEVTPVPEPHEYALMLMGLGLVSFAVRRKNK